LLMVINASIKRSRQAAAGTESSSTH
jgi:hypothetical protein